MAKVDLIHPLKGEPGKRYWVYQPDADLLDKPRWVQCYADNQMVKGHPVYYVSREGGLTITMKPKHMQNYRLVEIVAPDPVDVLRYMKKQRLIKPKPAAAETANILGI